MPKFDAELYLRMRGEDQLMARRPDNRPWGTPLDEPAAALVAVGALSAARARAVLADYALAGSLRTEQGVHHRRHFAARGRRRPAKVAPLPPRRVVPCDQTIESSNGSLRIHRVALSATETSVAATWRRPASAQPRSMMMHGGPPQATLSDDRGTTVTANFSGSGSSETWRGNLQAIGSLAVDTAWIEIDGERIELVGEPWPATVAIEPLPEQPPPLRHLWHELETREHWHGEPDLAAAIDAMVAAGALAADDPELDAIRSVGGGLPRHPRMGGRGRGAGTSSTGLPEPWKSALGGRSRSNGPTAILALDVVTPLFEGFSVAISSLRSGADHLDIEVEVSPGPGHPRWATTLDAPRLGWWAQDDRGGHFLGSWGNWSGSQDRSSGTINFNGALHPKAKEVRIVPTALRTRAVITIPLPT